MHIKWNRLYIPVEPYATQLTFLMLPHLEALFGGAAGGGKSEVLLMGATQYVDIPGYAALILRRTLTELKQPGALLDRAHKWFAPTNAKYDAENHTYIFPTKWPNGAPGHPSKIQFGYLGEYNAEIRYQGAEYQFCCIPQTPVLMEDGSYKAIGQIHVGDRVQTLQGLKRVTRTHSLRKECVLVVTKYGAQIHGTNHKFLQQPLPKVFENSKESYTSSKALSQTSLQSRNSLVTPETQYQDREHTSVESQQLQDSLLQAFYAYLKDGQNDSSKFDDVLRVIQPLPKLTVPSVLFSLPSQSTHTSDKLDLNKYDIDHAQPLFSIPSYVSDYPSLFRSYDEHRNLQEELNERQATLTDVDESSLQHLWLTQGGTQVHNHPLITSYTHPYTNREIQVEQTIASHLDVSTSYLLPLQGSFEVCDITVEDSSHYITMCGLVNANCGIDEATHFENDSAPTYLFSRLRKNVCPKHKLKNDEITGERVPNYVKGCKVCAMYESLPLRFRMASNPGGPGHFWLKDRYQIHKEIYTDDNGEKKVKWVGGVKSRPFIPSSLSDNEFIDQRGYSKSLESLDEIRQQQLRWGDWDISPDSRFNSLNAKFYTSRGEYFQLGPHVFHQEDFLEIFVTVDPAASTMEGPIDAETNKKKGPSYTVISVWGLTPDYKLVWIHMVRFREEIPYLIEQVIQINKMFKPKFILVEANGLGIGPAQILASRGVPIVDHKKYRDKIQNAANAIYRMKKGRIWFPEDAPWLRTCMDEVFSWTGHPGVPDDIVDTLSDACNYVTSKGSGVDPILSIEPDHNQSLPDNSPSFYQLPP